MDSSLSIFRKARWWLSPVLAIAAFSTGARAEPVESIRGRGILEKGALILLADVHGCGSEKEPPVAQIFVSSDGGQTWVKRGPAIPGSELEYALVAPDGIWIAGLHTAEGPGVDPFFLVPTTESALDWRLHPISEGPSELRGVGRAAPKEFIAWVRPVDVHEKSPPRSDVAWRSQDGGETWKADAPGRKPPVAAVKKFRPVTTRSGAYRIVDRKDGGFDLQRHGPGGWQLVKTFPWAACDAGTGGTRTR
jgi:hypothetical protein